MSTMTMTRSQWAYLKYRNNRYMQHLADSELSDRLDDCGNIGVGLKDGKVAVSNPIEGRPDDYPGFGFVWQKLADVFEEYRLRGRTERKEIMLPTGRVLIDAPIVEFPVKTPTIDYETEAKTGLGKRIVDAVESIQKKYPKTLVLVKYGQKRYMEQLAESGLVRIGTAKGFERDANHARQDYETSFEMYHAKKRTVRCNDYWLWCCTLASEGSIWVARCVHDFSADAAVVIADGSDFISEMRDMMRQRNAHFRGAQGMIYSDPLLDDVQPADIPFVKHFRYMYQREQRAVWESELTIHLDPIFLNVKADLRRILVE